jgi:hypothetical protein
MVCPKCKGAGGWSQQWPESIFIRCATCGGSGVLYTQAEIDELKREIEARDKIARKLAGYLSSPCGHCSYYSDKGGCATRNCIDGVIERARRQIEEDAGNEGK